MIYDMNIDENRRIDYDAKMEKKAKSAIKSKKSFKPRFKTWETHGKITESYENGNYYIIYSPNNGGPDVVIKKKQKERYDFSFKKSDPSVRLASTLVKADEFYKKYKENNFTESDVLNDDLLSSIKCLKQTLHYENKYTSENVLNELMVNNNLKNILDFYFVVVDNKNDFVDNFYIKENEYDKIKEIFENIIYVNENESNER